ncbi:histone-lysine N-methyltransferase SETMAR [Trichonephila clavipes]|nr:histone-lysine N-methyltransferase SETMAR [Trichonephila clavipes]
MDKNEYRVGIKYLFLKGNMPMQIKYELDSVYGDSAPSFTTVKFWAADFKRGRKRLGDVERLGCPNTATTDENIAKVQQMLLDDRRIKVRDSRGSFAEGLGAANFDARIEAVKQAICHPTNLTTSYRRAVFPCGFSVCDPLYALYAIATQ